MESLTFLNDETNTAFVELVTEPKIRRRGPQNNPPATYSPIHLVDSLSAYASVFGCCMGCNR